MTGQRQSPVTACNASKSPDVRPPRARSEAVPDKSFPGRTPLIACGGGSDPGSLCRGGLSQPIRLAVYFVRLSRATRRNYYGRDRPTDWLNWRRK